MKPFAQRALLSAMMLWQSEAMGQAFTEYLTGRPIYAILSDSKRGVIWFGTSGGGLSRFDGTRFTDYNTGNRSDLPDNFIRSLALDHNGNLWVGTSSMGAGYFDLKKDTLIFYDLFRPDNNEVRSITVDTLSQVWFGTNGGVVLLDTTNNWYRYTPTDYARWDKIQKRWVILKEYGETDNHLASNEVNAIAVGASDTLWFGTGRGVSMLTGQNDWGATLLNGRRIYSIWIDRRGDQWFGAEARSSNPTFYKLRRIGSSLTPEPVTVNCFANKAPSKRTIYAIIHDQEDYLWITTQEGTFRFDAININWRCSTGSLDLDSKPGRTMATDRDGNLWVGSLDPPGATKYTANWITFSTATDSIGGNKIFAIARDSTGQIWIGNECAVARYENSVWHANTYANSCLDPASQIQAIEVASDGTLWLGAHIGGVLHIKPDFSIIKKYKSAPNGLVSDEVFTIAIDRQFIWFGTKDGLSRLDLTDPTKETWRTFTNDNTGKGLINNEIRALAVDLQGRLWVGTPSGLSRYDSARYANARADMGWTSFTTSNTPQGLGSNGIKSITVDQQTGRLWFGTDGGGASSFLNGQWQRLTIEDGLADNFVEDVLILYKRKEIWFATGGGVSCRNDTTGQWTTYTINDGLADNHVTNLIQGDRAGEIIWFGTRADGVTRYRRQKEFPNTVILDPIDFTTQTEVVFRFLGNDLNTSKSLLRYSYKLNNEKWSPYTFDTSARLKVIERRLHTFYVKAIDRDNNEDPWPASKSFYRVHPDTGSYTTFIDTSKVYKLDTIKITFYLPPYQLRDSLEVKITPVPPDSLPASFKKTVFAYDLAPFEVNIEKKGVILAFEFPQTAKTPDQPYSIQRILNKTHRLDTLVFGGTQSLANGVIRLSTAIDQFGRYAVRPANSAAAQQSEFARTKVNAQPRIFSPRGTGHGPQTTLSFLLDNSAHVRIKVYNLAGRFICTVWDNFMSAGTNAVAWNGRDYNKQICPTGLYVVVLESNGFQSPPKPVKIMVLNNE